MTLRLAKLGDLGLRASASLSLARSVSPDKDGGVIVGSTQAATTLYPNTGKIDQWFFQRR